MPFKERPLRPGCARRFRFEALEERNLMTGLPDLIVSDLRVIEHPTYDIAYEYTIQNVGTAPANLDGPTAAEYDNVSVQAFLSADTVFNNGGDIAAGGTILGLSPLGMLQPGETFTGTFGCSVNFDPATHPYLTLKVDWGDVVAESDETNNTAAVRIDTTPPQVLSVQINTLPTDPPDHSDHGPQRTTGHQQRSAIRDLVITFTEDVQSVSAADLELWNLGTNSPKQADTQISLDAAQIVHSANQVTIILGDDELPKGVYQLRVKATVLDLAGNPLDGNGDGMGGDDYVLTGRVSGNRINRTRGEEPTSRARLPSQAASHASLVDEALTSLHDIGTSAGLDDTLDDILQARRARNNE